MYWWRKVVVVVLSLLLCAVASANNRFRTHNNGTTGSETWLVNNPAFSQTGELAKSTDIQKFKDLPPVLPTDNPEFRGWDNEAYDAIHRFFWGKEQGIVLEMGALDGKQFSVSHDFLSFQWHRILIEATPKWRHAARKLSTDATYVSAAICSSNSVVHYLSRPNTDNAINGIAEFMAEHFMQEMHPKVYAEATKGGNFDLSQVQWSKFTSHDTLEYADSTVHPMQCLRMDTLLDVIHVKKINLFVLDVEGGELEVLRSIDFSKISFDVLCIEVEQVHRPPQFKENVQRLLEQYNYHFVFEQGRNAWFKAANFQPSIYP